MSYPDHTAMERTLASPKRARNAKETEVLLAMVENPTVSHAVFEIAASSRWRHDWADFPKKGAGVRIVLT